jgi:nucleoside-diphosphate-sugar epimerase
MKKVLITGINSYVGKKFEEWLGKYPDQYSIDSISLRNDLWKKRDFSNYDTVFHVAGIAHVSSNSKMEDMYYKVNRDLAIETAIKAKKAGVKQFIFMSSIIVYGSSKGLIDRNTVPKPSDFYGDSKLQAEQGIKLLENENFKVVILRPPMIYGRGSKGNYLKLSKLAQKIPFFPDFYNQRSMLHIDNLCEFIKHMIDNMESGVFFPQNSEYVQTSEMVKLIAEVHGKKVRLVKLFNFLIPFSIKNIGFIGKVFGNMVYKKEISNYRENYRVWDLQDSIIETEKRN